MRGVTFRAFLFLLLTVSSMPGIAQQSAATVPNLVRFAGTLTDLNGKPLTNLVGVTFFFYQDAQGGSPLWTETQNVQPDSQGRYAVVLGSTTGKGLPASLFASGEARWLGVQAQGYEEQPRVLLLSVPYALKAGDAATIGGLPPSAFMLAAPTSESSGNSNGQSPNISAATVVNGAGTTDFIPLWTSAQFLGNSALFQSGSGSSALIGINTTTPASTLDVNGGVTSRGPLELPSSGTATASQGFNSQPMDSAASTFNSNTQQAANQTFRWLSEPVGNNTGTPTGKLNLLFGANGGTPAETGLSVGSNGLITFAAGQTFPGGGGGTITGVTAGTDLTGGGTVGNVTLNLDTTKVAQLGSNNSFTGTQQFTGNTGIGMAPSGTSYTPLSVGNSSSFGTWFALANSSSGGHTWNIISAGGANAEGAGNLGITDLTGKSTIWLEGTTNVTNGLTAMTQNYIAALLQGPESGIGSALEMQTTGTGGDSWQIMNTGASAAQGPNRLNFRNDSTGIDVMTLTSFGASGHVGIGTVSPFSNYSFDVEGSSSTNAVLVDGYGSNDALDVYGGNAFSGYGGGTAVYGRGGVGGDIGDSDGIGGFFDGGYRSGGVDGDALLARAGSGYAGDFYGNVDVRGTLYKSGGSFKIDHPLDPANKYLYHSFVESPDMMNIYNGIETLDAAGETTVTMPDWFSALNRDFRYQLTAVGAPGPNLYIAEELTNNRFKIAGGKPGMKVSWQVTGIRQDAWANAHRIPLEEVKNERERGFYIHPELYGEPAEKEVEWARHPEIMRHMKEVDEKHAAAAKTANGFKAGPLP